MSIQSIVWEDARAAEYELAIYCCGYETRASYVIQHQLSTSADLICLDYDSQGVHAYNVNYALFSALDCTQLKLSDVNFRSSIMRELKLRSSNSDPDKEYRILLDVSSCSRKLMAQLFLAIAEQFGPRAVVTCVYALSAFNAPPSSELPSHISEPVVGTLAGWSEDLTKPPCAVIGLGFEPGRALGCLDYLEIPEVRLFLPQGPDVRFENAVTSANKHLIAEVGLQSLLVYDVMNPADAYQRLESLLFGLIPRSRPVIIPLGPKIFSAIAICVAIQMLPKVCVWRTSAGVSESTADRLASGEVACFKVRMARILAGGSELAAV